MVKIIWRAWRCQPAIFTFHWENPDDHSSDPCRNRETLLGRLRSLPGWSLHLARFWAQHPYLDINTLSKPEWCWAYTKDASETRFRTQWGSARSVQRDAPHRICRRWIRVCCIWWNKQEWGHVCTTFWKGSTGTTCTSPGCGTQYSLCAALTVEGYRYLATGVIEDSYDAETFYDSLLRMLWVSWFLFREL